MDPMGLQEHEPSQDHTLLSFIQVSPCALSLAGAFPWSGCVGSVYLWCLQFPAAWQAHRGMLWLVWGLEGWREGVLVSGCSLFLRELVSQVAKNPDSSAAHTESL